MSNLDPIPYSEAQLRAILQRVKTIAMAFSTRADDLGAGTGRLTRLVGASRSASNPPKTGSATSTIRRRSMPGLS
jgi:hypothetical protein